MPCTEVYLPILLDCDSFPVAAWKTLRYAIPENLLPGTLAILRGPRHIHFSVVHGCLRSVMECRIDPFSMKEELPKYPVPRPLSMCCSCVEKVVRHFPTMAKTVNEESCCLILRVKLHNMSWAECLGSSLHACW